MIIDKLVPLGGKKEGSEPKPKSALKKHSTQQKRRVSFSDNKILGDHNLHKTDSKHSSNSSSNEQAAQKKMSPPTPFNMQNCLKPIGELKEENSYHEGFNDRVEPQP